MFSSLACLLPLLLLWSPVWSAERGSKKPLGTFRCPADQVLHVYDRDPHAIYLFCAHLRICNEQRPCTHIPGPCSVAPNGRSFISLISEKMKYEVNPDLLCCDYAPVDAHDATECFDMQILDRMRQATTTRAPSSLSGERRRRPASSRRHSNWRRTLMDGRSKRETQREMLIFERDTVREKRQVRGRHGSSEGRYEGKAEFFEHQIRPDVSLSGALRGIQKLRKGYMLNVCHLTCKDTTTTKYPTTTTPVEPTTQKAKPKPKQTVPVAPGAPFCFDAEGLVETRERQMRRLDQLKIGDWILTNSQGSQKVFSPVDAWYHRLPTASGAFVVITLRDNKTLSLTANHLLPVLECAKWRNAPSNTLNDLLQYTSVFASRASVGDCVIVAQDDGEFSIELIVAVHTQRKEGIYSPITSSGSIVVNGVYASCFTTMEDHTAQLAMHKIHTQITDVFGRILDWFQGAPVGTRNAQNGGVYEPSTSLQLIRHVADLIFSDVMF